MKILLADDDPIFRHIVRNHLKDSGYDLTVTESGEEAWETFQSGLFDLVISDWIMPGMDGPELVRRIRQSDQSDRVYIVMLTGRAETDDLVTGLQAGADDFLGKPVDPGELRARLRAAERVITLERRLSRQNGELRLANDRMKQDLDSAAKVQQALLPSVPPDTERFDFAWKYRPCDELAGDTLNVFPLDHRYIGLYVLDVSGHGVPAALLCVTLSRLLSPGTHSDSMLYTKRGKIAEPAEVLERLSSRFQMDIRAPQFFTIFYGVLDTQNGRLTYSSGGHPEGFLLRQKQTAARLTCTGTPVGIFQDAQYEQKSVDLQPHERLFLFSDGLFEARNQTGECFGLERLMSQFEQSRGDELQSSIDQTSQAVIDWSAPAPPADDISVLGLLVR